MDLNVLVQGLLEFTRGAVGASANASLRERGKPALDLIEPERRSRGEVNVEARVASKPVLDGRRLVGAVVVHHQMHVQHLRHARIDRAQEQQELAAAVTPMGLADDRTAGDIVGGKERRGEFGWPPGVGRNATASPCCRPRLGHRSYC